MDTLTLIVVIAVAGVVVLVAGGLALTRGRRSKAPLAPLTDLEERPGERAAQPSGDVKILTPDVAAPPAPTREEPAPGAGRMARLRARLGPAPGARRQGPPG